MKKQSFYAISKKVFSFLLALIITVGISQSGYAASGSADKDSNKNKGVEITYQGARDKNLVFNVNYKNELSQPFQLIITNDQYQVIYSQTFDTKPLNRTILFSELPENCKLTFSIVSGKKEISQAFEINSQVRTVEEYVVKGL